MAAKNYMALDQYGNTYHDLGPHPRKTLLARLGRKHAERVYRDIGGKPHKVGWIIAGYWFSVYEVVPIAVAV